MYFTGQKTSALKLMNNFDEQFVNIKMIDMNLVGVDGLSGS